MKEQELQQLTLFLEDSPVSPFPWLESKKVKRTIATSGLKCSELSGKLAHVGYLVRTYLESCELPLSTLYRVWSVKDTMLPCLILKLRLSELRTGESASLLWPTPTQRDYKGARKPETLIAKGRTPRNSLPDAVGNGGQLNPTWVEWLMGFPIGWTDLDA